MGGSLAGLVDVGLGLEVLDANSGDILCISVSLESFKNKVCIGKNSQEDDKHTAMFRYVCIRTWNSKFCVPSLRTCS